MMWFGSISELVCLASLALIAGCAAPPRISDSERQKITHVVVKESHAGPTAALSSMLPESGGSGLLSGTLIGLAAGLHPYTWIFGGPVMTVPFFAYENATCGAEVSEVGDPAGELKSIFADVEPDAFRKAIDSALNEHLAVRIGKEAGQGATAATPWILDIYELGIIMESGSLKDEDLSCRPLVRAIVAWRVSNPVDRADLPLYLEDKSSGCSIPATAETFKEWFEKPGQRSKDITALLGSLGRHVADQLFSGRWSKCDYGQLPADPTMPGANDGGAGGAPAIRDPDYLECVNRGVGICDDYVNCFSGGRRQWTKWFRCD